MSESPSHPVTQPPPSAELTSKPHPITPARRHNLPAFLPPMIGRDEQLAQLVALIDNPTERLITIVGMGGMGKTRLALALLETLAAEAPPPFVDGFWFVPLGSVAENAHELAAALAEAALNVLATNVPQGGAPSATLLHYLAQRQLLLVFDNLEHLLLTERTAMAVSNFLLALLQAAPTVKLLTTSRIPLQLLPETVIRLEGLSVPNARSNHEQEKVDDAGLRLFAYHAQRVLPTFTLTHENVTAISALCRQLGGMPLAIQLAAALTPHFRVNELVTAIHQNLALLTSTRRDLDVRHRHFGALLASTWQQLTIDEQRILAQSTIFVGHFSRAAAQAVTGATVADLSALVDKSLIQQPAVAEYQLHPLLHQFAAERMRDQFRALQGEVADQHSRYYLDFVALRSARMARHDLQRAIAEIQHELDNVRQAWAWTVASIRQGCDTTFPGNPADLCRRLDNAIHPLWQFYVITCRYTEGNTLLQGAVLALQSLLAETGEREKVLQQLLSKLLGLQATFLCIQGKNEQAMAIAEEARRKSLLWGSRDGEILGLNGLVHVHYCHGHFAQAKAYAEAILAAIQQPAAANEQPWPSEIAVSAQCMMHIYLGAMARIADDYPAATQHFTQSLQLCQSLGKLMGTMDARMNLANLARCKQNYTAARLEYEEALAIACQLGNLRGEGVVRYELGDVLCGLGDYAAALTQLTRAVALFREIDDPLLESHTTSALAICYSLLGDYATAKNFYEQALHQSESLPMTDAKSAAWLAASLFYHYTGNHQQALAYAQYSHQSAQAQQSRQGEAVALLHIAFADEGLGLWTEAAATYAQAQQLYQRLDIPPSRMEAEAGLARVALTQGETAAALAWVEKLLPILAAHPTGGLYTPFRIYLTCYQVLTANADPRAAALLQQGVTTLRRYANQLPDDTLRCSFLEDVATHRALSQAYLSTNHD